MGGEILLTRSVSEKKWWTAVRWHGEGRQKETDLLGDHYAEKPTHVEWEHG